MIIGELACAQSPFAQSAAADAPVAASDTPAAPAKAEAGTHASGRETPQLDTISVTANRIGTSDVDRMAATVSVITSKEMEDDNVKDVKDALRYEPGVEVRRQAYRPAGITGTAGRAGNEGINIRGLEGNQVLLLEDGIPLPQSFGYGSGSAGRADYLNTDFYSRIEVLRGPASVLYGSDGLTGAVNFVTKDPGELLALYGRPTYFSLKGDYDSTDRSWGSTAAAAFGNDTVQGMVILSGRHGHETDNMGKDNSLGAGRSTPDPLTYNNRSALGKFVFRISPQDRLKLTAETLNNASTGYGLSQLDGAYAWSGYAADGYVTTNQVTSHRAKLEWDHDDASNPWVQHFKGSVFYRNAATDQALFITGARASGATAGRSRLNHYDDNIVGGSLVAASAFKTGRFDHRVTYGLDTSVSHYSTRSSAGSEWTSTSSDGYPEVFPKTSEFNLGAYVQDEIRWNRLSFVPGLRFDYYRMSPQTDSVYDTASAASTQATTSSSGNALSPRVALLYEINPAVVPYVQYARGFRAPSAYQVNSYYGANGSYGIYYQQVGNPNLKPETSNTVELGLRGRLALGANRVRYGLAAFYGRYSDFIDMKVVGGSFTSATHPYTYQYVNDDRATIKGLEAKAQWFVGEAVEINAGLAWIKGTAEQSGVTTGLDSVPPLAAVLGVKYRFADRWFVAADTLYNARKDKRNMSSPSYFSTPSYTILDLHAGYRVAKHVSLTAGIGNVFDRKYWRWNDVRGLADSDGIAKINALTAPGRTFNAGMKLDF
ncbi:TonB-dependent hemoglobin/transferrin/lactoferrin family receptor [Burkholderia sp. WAC0059]|uniref:TonB-dependent hemoglobin/transferrin/lactoferrin family receptor n=1 Tax=Burkholderia sp. WAC0059 TaxID=2066022 RepID=UPI000C7EFB61|nr:TonB-dependent hemoglobin/transferrin/lactoferrin family receptor [Burkholderia sp. WAC0059]